MIKKTFIFAFSLWMLAAACFPAQASEGAKVILDLAEHDEALEDDVSVPQLLEMGGNYINDVKEYDKLLEGRDIDKDIVADIRSKYPDYSDKMAEDWASSVKKGIKVYRFFKDIKEKAVRWVMEQEAPIVVDDNQYEMGEQEKYIESDVPLVFHDFKKVVAYSDSERDQLAAREKYAKDYGLKRPSKIIEKYKQALLNKDWAALFDFKWTDLFKNVYAPISGKGDVDQPLLKGVILPQYNGINKDGKFAGVIELRPKEKFSVLFKEYQNYSGLNVDFSKSENIEQTEVHFVLPRQVRGKDNKSILIYPLKFPVYFTGKAKNPEKPVILRPEVSANLCQETDCESLKLHPELVLEPKEEASETTFSTYIQLVSQNIPQQENGKEFRFKNLVFEKNKQTGEAYIKLKVICDDAPHFNIFISDENSKYFDAPKLKIDDDKVAATFRLSDSGFSPVGKTITFWVSVGSNKQHLHQMTVEEASWFNAEDTGYWGKMLAAAGVGGLLLNLMPSVFPFLILKILAFSKFGGLNFINIRGDFSHLGAGVLLSFVLFSAIFAVMNASGDVFGWGMQFQNIGFLIFMIWVVFGFLAYILELADFNSIVEKLLGSCNKKRQIISFLSGMFVAVLSLGSMAPYLSNAFGMALRRGTADIALVVFVTGCGLALPYLLFAAWPQLSHFVPKQKKTLDIMKFLTVCLPIISILQLLFYIVAQTNSAQIWHWAGYLFALLFVLFFKKAIIREINKLDDDYVARILYRRAAIIFSSLVVVIIGLSLADSLYAASKRDSAVSADKSTEFNTGIIAGDVRMGNKVLVKIDALWCFVCKYNDAFVFNTKTFEDVLQRYEVRVIEGDWSGYSPAVSDFMQKFGRSNVPLYVLFSRQFPDGIVLSELPDFLDMESLIEM